MLLWKKFHDKCTLVTFHILTHLSPKQINIPEHLMVKKYPHFLEREPSYNSISVLGNIYDLAKSQQESEIVPPISKLLFLAGWCRFLLIRSSDITIEKNYGTSSIKLH